MIKILTARSNMALDLAPFGRWTLRDIAAQRRSPPLVERLGFHVYVRRAGGRIEDLTDKVDA